MATVMITPSSTRVLPEPDLYLQPSKGPRIPAHATILASASPVLENIIMANKAVKIQGVPYDAVTAFVRYLYSGRCTEEEMDKCGMHLLALSHVYLVRKLKQRCVEGLAKRVTEESVVDVLQLARLCDAPDLYLKCVKLLTLRYETVKKTEGWRFLQNHDPALELDILRLIEDHETRKKKSRRRREEESVYKELSEAMECLEHICREGCTLVGPNDVDHRKEPCSKFATCQGIQGLICHLGRCKRRVSGGCLRCKRLWQLFRLHSSLCQHRDDDLSCKVPLCREMKMKMEEKKEKRKDDARWRVLVRKVASAKAMSSLSSLSKRKSSSIDQDMISIRGTTTSFISYK